VRNIWQIRNTAKRSELLTDLIKEGALALAGAVFPCCYRARVQFSGSAPCWHTFGLAPWGALVGGRQCAAQFCWSFPAIAAGSWALKPCGLVLKRTEAPTLSYLITKA